MSPDGASRAVLITGCSTGIGRATAQRLASDGHVVYASARVGRIVNISSVDPPARTELDAIGVATWAEALLKWCLG